MAKHTICAICEQPIVGEEPWKMGHPDAPEDELLPIHGECMGITEDLLREDASSALVPATPRKAFANPS